MKFVYPGINTVFDTEIGKVNVLVIENQNLLTALIRDLTDQIAGLEGKAVISEGNKVLPLAKNAELLSAFFPFEINKKPLLTKATAALVQQAVEDDYELTRELLGELESFLLAQTMKMVGDIEFQKINLETIVRSVGMTFEEAYDSLAEKIIDYFELVLEYDRQKLFILLNLRSFIDDEEATRFFDTILRQQYHVLLIESCEHTHLPTENCLIVDRDLCEISCIRAECP